MILNEVSQTHLPSKYPTQHQAGRENQSPHDDSRGARRWTEEDREAEGEIEQAEIIEENDPDTLY